MLGTEKQFGIIVCFPILYGHKLIFRGNNLDTDDMVGLRYALAHLPNLEVLDISDNPIEDDGIR